MVKHLAKIWRQFLCYPHSPIYLGIVMTMRGPCIKGRCVYCGKEAVGKCAVRSV